ncbi:MAG: cytochrome P450 [Pseudomonadota bacterium]
MIPPKPASRPRQASLWRYFRLFRQDILSAQPAHLYRARMAEFRTPFFRSFLLGEPDLVEEVLKRRPEDFPKSDRISEGLRPLLGQSVFLTNGETWRRQRRLIDPAFDRGKLAKSFPAMLEAGTDMLARLRTMGPEPLDVEPPMSRVAADIIFRTLFSIPITEPLADEIFQAFRAYQRQQPLLNAGAVLTLPRWMPRGHRQSTREAAKRIRMALLALIAERAFALREGCAPDDLATALMTARDPETGRGFSEDEMLDQVAIFFLAGHETSAAALAWALMLLAMHPAVQDRVAEEVRGLPENPSLSDISGLTLTRNVWRETLRLYAPVPMMVREASRREVFRERRVPKGAQIVISPWHLHRHERHWEAPDAFDPDRFDRAVTEGAYLPFSAGPRICPGAGFAMVEGPLILALICRAFRLTLDESRMPVPVAHLTVRSRDGIYMSLTDRSEAAAR